ncbi:YncE family protein [Rummeliibacillus sp. JY-2-4R]
MRWHKFALLLFLTIIVILSGCGKPTYSSIPKDQDFIASVNIQAPSISFIDEKGKVFTTWNLKEGYTGATLIDKDQILLYGFQLKKASVYSLTTGKLVYSIDTEEGITNAIYDAVHNLIYLANGKANRVVAYNNHGNKVTEQKVGNYPMSMLIHDGQLYVVNYKDTKLSILQTKSLTPIKNWTISKSSNGMIVVKDKELWLGGHGEGIKPNSTIDVMNLKTGEKESHVKLPMMPVGFAKSNHLIYVISHGESTLSEVTFDGKVKRQLEVGANPFSVNIFKEYVVVAGYDDHHVYFLQNGKIAKTINVGKGPFQLLVRGENQ